MDWSNLVFLPRAPFKVKNNPQCLWKDHVWNQIHNQLGMIWRRSWLDLACANNKAQRNLEHLVLMLFGKVHYFKNWKLGAQTSVHYTNWTKINLFLIFDYVQYFPSVQILKWGYMIPVGYIIPSMPQEDQNNRCISYHVWEYLGNNDYDFWYRDAWHFQNQKRQHMLVEAHLL